MSEEQTVKGKVVRENVELWDKTYPGGPKSYHSRQGIVDFVITPNVLSWVNQGLVELYKGGKDNVSSNKEVAEAPVENPAESPAEDSISEDSDTATTKEPSKSKSKSKKKRKKG